VQPVATHAHSKIKFNAVAALLLIDEQGI